MQSNLARKEQVTAPKKFRDYLGLQPGEAMEFAFGPQGEVVVRTAKKMQAPAKARRLGRLRDALDTGRGTDELMALLRGYDADAADPGLQ